MGQDFLVLARHASILLTAWQGFKKGVFVAHQGFAAASCSTQQTLDERVHLEMEGHARVVGCKNAILMHRQGGSVL